MQDQTARVHQLFLEGQLAAHRSLQALMGAPGAAMGHSLLAETVMGPEERPKPAAPPTPSLPAAPQPRPPQGDLDIVALLLAVVAETTGYPETTLSLDMGMEADLGIDSIKRVEILSMLSKRVPGAPSVNPEKLGALRTLKDVADFISAAKPAVAVASHATNGHAVNGHAHPGVDRRAVLLEVVSQLTGYPLETLALEMDMEADLGIDSIKRVEILSLLSRRIPGAPTVNPEKLAKLRTLQQVLHFVSATESPVTPPKAPAVASLHRRAVVAVAAPALVETALPLPEGLVAIADDASGLAEALAACFASVGRVARVITSADDVTGPLGTLVLLAPDEASSSAAGEAALKRALGLARTLGPRLREGRAAGAHEEALLVTVSRRDGAFGLATRAPHWNPLAGGLAGLAKTAAHEWPEVKCRAIDVASIWATLDAARAVVSELQQHGPRETGLGPAGRITLALRPSDALPLPPRLGPGSVIVVTGGARGVTAVSARALAIRTGATLLLIGRSPVPAEEPAWLNDATTEAAIKRACLDNAAEGRPAPKVLGEMCQAILAGREIRASLAAHEQAGVRAVYRSVDVRDAEAVAAAIAEARASLGPIHGVVHGAGVVKDKRILDKRDEDFDQVLDPKLAGLRAVLTATKDDDLRALVLFASATGRFGRRGQCDYAVANQALVSVAQSEAARRPYCRVVALDWGPWEGGMVGPALQKEFEREGVPLIGLLAGAEAMTDEALTAPGGPVEVVLGAGFGAEESAEWVLAGTWRLDAATFPILRDHTLAGKAVLPFALSLAWLAAAATAVSGRPVLSLDDVRVFRGLNVGAEPQDVSVWVGPLADRADHDERAESRVTVELRDGQHVLVRGVAVVGAPTPVPEALPPPTGLRPFRTPIDRVYREQLFHGPSLEAIASIDGIGESGMSLSLHAHPTSERLLPGSPVTWTIDPLVLDGVFQALILWCRAHVGAPSLPSHVGSLKIFAPLRTARARAVIRVVSTTGAVVTSDVDVLDDQGQLSARLERFTCTASASLQRAFLPEPVAIAPPSTA
jgi:NAD(P)-dependent dehydrogenase (short-subunit alcohol dehydrogenase family)/acyl carrier protein